MQADIFYFNPEKDLNIITLNGFKGFYIAREERNSFDGLFIYHWEESYDKAQEWKNNFIKEYYEG